MSRETHVTAKVRDFYKRRFKPGDAPYLRVSKRRPASWGLFACGVAVGTSLADRVVNRFGCFLYGSIFGVCILAIAVPRAPVVLASRGIKR